MSDMMNAPSVETSVPEDVEPPGWLLAALQPPAGTPALQNAFVRAADAALALTKLRHASQRFGFSFLDVPAYLRGLSGRRAPARRSRRLWLGPGCRWTSRPGLPSPTAGADWPARSALVFRMRSGTYGSRSPKTKLPRVPVAARDARCHRHTSDIVRAVHRRRHIPLGRGAEKAASGNASESCGTSIVAATPSRRLPPIRPALRADSSAWGPGRRS